MAREAGDAALAVVANDNGIDIGDLVAGHATLQLNGRNGKSLNLSYNPQKVTPLALMGEDNESFGRALIDFELEWDLMSNGKPMPNNMEGYLSTPLGVLSLVFNSILKAQRVDPK